MVENYDEIKRRLDFIVKANQTTVVENLLEKFPDLQDDIINLEEPFNAAEEPGECGKCWDEAVEIDEDTGLCEECHESNAELREVYEWWLIEGGWTSQFRNNGLITLRAFGCTWYGRTCTGQALYLDQEFEFLAKNKKKGE
jgi:hypothetical protein